jgi:hypothetical protein
MGKTRYRQSEGRREEMAVQPGAEGDVKGDSEPRFVCDVMLGRLARWLRFLGYDTLYRNDASDEDLIEDAGREGRILLTGDTRMSSSSRNVTILRIRNHSLGEQLREIGVKVDMTSPPGLFQRCSLCNTLLREVTGSCVEGRVPEYVRCRHESFFSCPTCGRVYWPGSHRRGMLRTLQSLLITSSTDFSSV